MFTFLGEKFELRLLKASDILLHEEVEPARYERLYQRLKDDKVLYNPLIVGKTKKNYVLIDGANRFQALKKLGAKLILAQIVDYKSPSLKLKTWYHFANEMAFEDLKVYLEGKGLEYAKWNIKSGISKTNNIGAAGTNGRGIKIKLSKKPGEALGALRELNRYYENNFGYTRIDSDANFKNLKEVFPGEGLLFVYPVFPKEQIIKIASGPDKVPAGITRHLLPNRVLHIKFDVSRFYSDEDIEERNLELEDILRQKASSKKIRLYREPVLIFDE